MQTGLREMCLEITAACPMACSHCSSFEMGQDRLNPAAVMPTTNAKGVIADFASMGGQTLQISGGEPLLHPDLFDLIGFGRGLGLSVRLYSSGLLGLKLREVRPIDEGFAKGLKAAGLERIIFNVQGASAQTHERITRTPRSFACVTASIEASRRAGLWVGVHFVPMKLNHTELEAVVELARTLDADEIAVLRFVPQGRGEYYREVLELSATELLDVGRRTLKLKETYDRPRIRTGSPLNFLTEIDDGYQPVKCSAGRSTCNVTADGNIVPCPAFKKLPGFAVGNVLRQRLSEAWQSHPVLNVMRNRTEQELAGECFAQIVASKGESAQAHRRKS